MLPAFQANAVGRIAAVAHEPNLLAQLIDGVGQRNGRRHGQLRAVRLALARIAVLVKVEQQRGAGQCGRLVDLAVEEAGAGRRAPVNTIERITSLIRPHAGDARGILIKPVNEPHVADGPPRRQVVPLERHHLGIDKQVVRLGIHPIAAVQPEQVAALHDQGADLVVAALGTFQVIARLHFLTGRQHADLQALAADAQARRPLLECLPRQQILEKDPGHRQPAGVADFEFDPHRVADFRRKLVTLPCRR